MKRPRPSIRDLIVTPGRSAEESRVSVVADDT